MVRQQPAGKEAETRFVFARRLYVGISTASTADPFKLEKDSLDSTRLLSTVELVFEWNNSYRNM